MRKLPPHRVLPLVIAISIVLQGSSHANTDQVEPSSSSGAGVPDEAISDTEGRNAGTQILRHIYAVYLSLRTCSNLAVEPGKAGYTPSVTLEEARRALQSIDGAAKSAGIDVAQIWSDIAPLGLVTAEALRTDNPEHLAACRVIGGVFHTDEANLQVILRKLGKPVELIQKDY